jgi:hypothetical protein
MLIDYVDRRRRPRERASERNDLEQREHGRLFSEVEEDGYQRESLC